MPGAISDVFDALEHLRNEILSNSNEATRLGVLLTGDVSLIRLHQRTLNVIIVEVLDRFLLVGHVSATSPTHRFTSCGKRILRERKTRKGQSNECN